MASDADRRAPSPMEDNLSQEAPLLRRGIADCVNPLSVARARTALQGLVCAERHIARIEFERSTARQGQTRRKVGTQSFRSQVSIACLLETAGFPVPQVFVTVISASVRLCPALATSRTRERRAWFARSQTRSAVFARPCWQRHCCCVLPRAVRWVSLVRAPT